MVDHTRVERKPPHVRSAVTANPMMARADGRSAFGRRLRDLYRSYMNALGNPVDAGTQAMILSAAEQVIGAEKERADYFAGNVPYNSVIRAEGAANRALKRLGLNKPPQPRQLSIAEQLAARGYRPPVAPSTDPGPEQRRDETAACEPADVAGEAST